MKQEIKDWVILEMVRVWDTSYEEVGVEVRNILIEILEKYTECYRPKIPAFDVDQDKDVNKVVESVVSSMRDSGDLEDMVDILVDQIFPDSVSYPDDDQYFRRCRKISLDLIESSISFWILGEYYFEYI